MVTRRSAANYGRHASRTLTVARIPPPTTAHWLIEVLPRATLGLASLIENIFDL